jgi:hypothetical protein
MKDEEGARSTRRAHELHDDRVACGHVDDGAQIAGLEAICRTIVRQNDKVSG